VRKIDGCNWLRSYLGMKSRKTIIYVSQRPGQRGQASPYGLRFINHPDPMWLHRPGTVQQITENPYLQYFIGLKEYQLTKPFTPVALVKFRKRFNAKRLARINELIVAAEVAHKTTQNDGDQDDHHHDDHDPPTGLVEGSSEPVTSHAGEAQLSEPAPNQGTLILDATCTPADIHYPTDLGLLNEAREKLDELIDKLHGESQAAGREDPVLIAGRPEETT